jgi:Ni,Fe-hydrogenase III large subunit
MHGGSEKYIQNFCQKTLVEKMKLRLAHIGENNIKVDVRYGIRKRPLERPRCR